VDRYILPSLAILCFLYALIKAICWIDKKTDKINLGGYENAVYDKKKDRREERGDASGKRGTISRGGCEDPDNNSILKTQGLI